VHLLGIVLPARSPLSRRPRPGSSTQGRGGKTDQRPSLGLTFRDHAPFQALTILIPVTYVVVGLVRSRFV
jgi:hypothetical protein